jgi:hypothetical protein
LTRGEAEVYFEEQIALSEGNEEAISSWSTLKFEALKYMDQGSDPDMVMFALKIAIEEQQAKGSIE